MAAIASQVEALERNREEFAAISTTLVNPDRKKFPVLPYYEVVRPVRYPHQLRNKFEELRTDGIAGYTLARSIAGQNVSFIQASARAKRGKFLSSLGGCLPAHLPQPKSKLQDSELDEEEPTWRGVFPLRHGKKVLFSKEIEVKVDELPAWKPHVVIDSYRLEDDDE